MGYQPKRNPRFPSPTGEDFHLHMARSAYVDGKMEVEEFEDCVAHVLAGGHLNQYGKRPEPGYDSCGRPLVLTSNELRAAYLPLTLDHISE